MRKSITSIIAMAALIVTVGNAAAAETKAPNPPWEGLQVIKGKRAYADTPLGQVHYTVLGDGPAMLMLHQTPWFSVQFAKATPLLVKAGFRTISVDTPGYGLSAVPDHPPTAEEYADNLVAVLDQLKIKKVIVIGHHTGVTIGAAFATRHPDRVACMVMHGIPLYTEEERAERMKNQLMPDYDLAADGSHIIARWSYLQSYSHEQITPESTQWGVLSFLLAGNTEWYGHKAAFQFDMAAAVKAIKAPTLIMSNTADTIHMSAARALKMRPDFAYHEFPDGTTHMMYDEPVLWAAPIIKFATEKCRG